MLDEYIKAAETIEITQNYALQDTNYVFIVILLVDVIRDASSSTSIFALVNLVENYVNNFTFKFHGKILADDFIRKTFFT